MAVMVLGEEESGGFGDEGGRERYVGFVMLLGEIL